MCGGGGPEKPKPTASERASVAIAERELQHFDTVYAPLEQEAINESSRENLATESRILRGRANADLAAEADANSKADVISLRNSADRFITDSGAAADDLSRVSSQTDQSARATATNRFTNKRLDVVKTGRDMARGVQSGLGDQINRETNTALTNLRNANLKRNSSLQAITTLASGAAQGIARREQTKTPEPSIPVDPRLGPNYGPTTRIA